MFHHGWPLSSDDWDAQMLFFMKNGFRVVAHDAGAMAARSKSATATTWTIMPPTPCGRRASRPAQFGTYRHSTGGGEVAAMSRSTASRRAASPGGAGRSGPADHGEDRRLSKRLGNQCVRRLPRGYRRQPRAILPRTSPLALLRLHREGATVYPGVIDNWWRQGMIGSAKAHYDGIKAFSETGPDRGSEGDDGPHAGELAGDDDQVVRIIRVLNCRQNFCPMQR